MADWFWKRHVSRSAAVYGGILLILLAAGAAGLTVRRAAAEESEGRLTITYFDSADGADPVAGAEFTCFKIGNMKHAGDGAVTPEFSPIADWASGELLSREDGVRKVAEAAIAAYERDLPPGGGSYRETTGKDGKAVIRGISRGVYVAAETKPAAGHMASEPFVFSLPHTEKRGASGEDILSYEVSAEPKPVPCGELLITKEVRGNGGDRTKEFRFSVRFDVPGTYPCRRSDGKEFTVAGSGEILLRHGQTVLIGMIPVGTAYEVAESDPGRDGYAVESTGTSGRIRRKMEAKASFINTKYRSGGGGSGGSGQGTFYPARTGDVSGAAIWAAALAVSGLISGICLRKRKRREL